MNEEDQPSCPKEAILAALRGSRRALVKLTDEATYRVYIDDYEIEEAEWSGDEGYFSGIIKFPDVVEPERLGSDQYPTELGRISATITDDGWEEIGLSSQVQRVKDDELERWETVSLGEVADVEVIEDE